MTDYLIDTNIHSIRWADSEVVAIAINYDSVSISLIESDGNAKTVICDGYIGYKTCGFWDEMVIESGRIKEKHPFIEECVQIIEAKYKSDAPLTGNNTRNEQNWRLLEIMLLDGTPILVVCGGFSVVVDR